MARLRYALDPFKSMPKTEYTHCGIARRFFPKWVGWEILDKNPNSNVDNLVEDFYAEFFWNKLELDKLECQTTAELIFVFAVQNGKKKTIEKLVRVCGEDWLYTCNDFDKFLELYAEFTELCIVNNKLSELKKLLSIYNKYIIYRYRK